MLTVLFGLFGLGIIVFIHELGHFVAAKSVGIEVETFSLGWGRRAFGFERGGTTYQVSWFPIGGYCKMKGEMLRPDMSADEEKAVRTETGSFLAAPAWHRILVAFAGPLANFIFAIAVVALIWWVGFRIHSADNRIILASEVQQGGELYPADRANLRTGDRIVALDGQPVENFWQISDIVRRNPDRELQAIVERDGRRLSTTLTPERESESGMGRVGIYSWIDPVIAEVEAGSPADMAALLPGDRLTAVGEETVANEVDFYFALQKRIENGQLDPVEISYQRGSATGRATLTFPVASEDEEFTVGIGFVQPVFRSPKVGPLRALSTGVSRATYILRASLAGLRQLFRMRDRRLNEVVAGPIRITQMVGEAATLGFRLGLGVGLVSFFQFVSLLSIAIAIMNLMPLPALDGGMIVLSTAEAVSRRPLSPRFLWRFQILGIVVIVGLIFLALTSDILSFLG
jgi:regulator of sigma E protease